MAPTHLRRPEKGDPEAENSEGIGFETGDIDSARERLEGESDDDSWQMEHNGECVPQPLSTKEKVKSAKKVAQADSQSFKAWLLEIEVIIINQFEGHDLKASKRERTKKKKR